MHRITRSCLFAGLGMVAAVQLASAQAAGPETKALYDKECKRCHGAQGTPAASMKKMMPKLPVLDAALMKSISDDSLVAVLKNGKGTMKPFAGKMTAEQMKALAQYVRQLAAS